MWDAENGITGCVDDGAGAVAYVTKDGGVTFPQNTTVTSVFFPLATGVAGNGNAAVITGPITDIYTTDRGVTFTSSLGGGKSQDVATIGGVEDGIIIAGGALGLGPADGVAISKDNGALFQDINAPVLGTQGRYVAAPNTQTIYVTAGQFPNENPTPSNDDNADDDPSVTSALRGGRTSFTHRLNPVMSVRTERSAAGTNTKRTLRAVPTANTAARPASVVTASPPGPTTTGVAGQLAVSKDGGKTWTSQLWTEQFYFNDIDCADESTCCAAAEFVSSTPVSGTTPGAFIYCTTDGGDTWTRNHDDASPGASLFGMSYAGNGIWWAAGANLAGTLRAQFWQSTDNGKTWVLSPEVDGYYAISAQCLPLASGETDAKCWASAANSLDMSSILRSF